MPFKAARYLKCYRSVCNGGGRADPLCLLLRAPAPIHLSTWIYLAHPPRTYSPASSRRFYLPDPFIYHPGSHPFLQPLTSSTQSRATRSPLVMALFSSFKARWLFSRFRAKKHSADASRDGTPGVAGTGKTSCKDLTCNSDSST